jgi:hypothetical protein
LAGPRECSAPPESGACNAYLQRWYLDIATGICKPFVYGGCGGNANNYESLAACQAACPSTNPSYDHCDVAADCTLGPAGCCGECDGPNVGAHSLIAYARRYEAEVRSGCGDVACGGCSELPGFDGQLKYFVPDCVDHQCIVLDIRTSEITACADDQQCIVRHGTSCCPACDSNQRVAISRLDLLQAHVCSADSNDCPTIGCNLPEGSAAHCVEGHCALGASAAGGEDRL